MFWETNLSVAFLLSVNAKVESFCQGEGREEQDSGLKKLAVKTISMKRRPDFRETSVCQRMSRLMGRVWPEKVPTPPSPHPAPTYPTNHPHPLLHTFNTVCVCRSSWKCAFQKMWIWRRGKLRDWWRSMCVCMVKPMYRKWRRMDERSWEGWTIGTKKQ